MQFVVGFRVLFDARDLGFIEWKNFSAFGFDFLGNVRWQTEVFWLLRERGQGGHGECEYDCKYWFHFKFPKSRGKSSPRSCQGK
jgi:hypothetical protein